MNLHKLEAMKRLYTGGLRKRLSPTAFWLLGYYAMRMNDECEAWPSAEVCARDGEIDVKHVERARKELVDGGYLIRLDMHRVGNTWVRKFRAVLPELTRLTPAESAPPQDAPPPQL